MENEQRKRWTKNVVDTNQDPIRYIDSLKNKQHVALFYEDQEYARIIEFRFIKNGLDLGEQCIYATGEDSGSIVLKMLTYGIPMKYFQTGRLKVYQLHHTSKGHDSIMDNCRKDIGKILSDLKSPFRIVSRIVHDVSTIDGMSVELELECSVHKDFEGFGGSLLCPYDLTRVESVTERRWETEIMENHHAVIYAPSFGEGTVFLQKDRT